MSPEEDPWLSIPAEAYEAHMSAVGQSAVLRAMFFRVYTERRPRRLAVLGCTTGADLQRIDVAHTELAIGVDLNPTYLALARARLAALGPRLRLVEGDVMRAELPAHGLDLVHAALLLEYVDPLGLFRRILGWLAPGGACSIVTQDPAPGVPAVSETRHAAALQPLAARMRVRDARQVTTLAAQCGLRLVRQDATPVGSKSLVSSVFEA